MWGASHKGEEPWYSEQNNLREKLIRVSPSLQHRPVWSLCPNISHLERGDKIVGVEEEQDAMYRENTLRAFSGYQTTE